MSDWLVQLQEKLAEYPSWMIAGAAGFVLAVIFILIGKSLRVLGVALLIGVLVAAGWFVWENTSGQPKEPATAPAAAPGESPAAAPAPAPNPPL